MPSKCSIPRLVECNDGLTPFDFGNKSALFLKCKCNAGEAGDNPSGPKVFPPPPPHPHHPLSLPLTVQAERQNAEASHEKLARPVHVGLGTCDCGTAGPHAFFCGALRGKGRGVRRVREGRGGNSWGPMWF